MVELQPFNDHILKTNTKTPGGTTIFLFYGLLSEKDLVVLIDIEQSVTPLSHSQFRTVRILRR